MRSLIVTLMFFTTFFFGVGLGTEISNEVYKYSPLAPTFGWYFAWWLLKFFAGIWMAIFVIYTTTEHKQKK